MSPLSTWCLHPSIQGDFGTVTIWALFWRVCERNCSQYTVLCCKHEEMVCSFYEKAIYQRRTFLGCSILLRIHNVHNYWKVWSGSTGQYLVHSQELMTSQRYQLIGTFSTLSLLKRKKLPEDQLQLGSNTATGRSVNCLHSIHIHERPKMIQQSLQKKRNCLHHPTLQDQAQWLH